MDLLSLPEFLMRVGGKSSGHKIIGLVLGEIKCPPKLEWITLDGSATYVLVDMIGVAMSEGTQYLVKGRVVVAVSKHLAFTCSRSATKCAFEFSGGLRLFGSTNSAVCLVTIWKRNNVWGGKAVDAKELTPEDYAEFFAISEVSRINNISPHADLFPRVGYVEAGAGIQFAYTKVFARSVRGSGSGSVGVDGSDSGSVGSVGAGSGSVGVAGSVGAGSGSVGSVGAGSGSVGVVGSVDSAAVVAVAPVKAKDTPPKVKPAKLVIESREGIKKISSHVPILDVAMKDSNSKVVGLLSAAAKYTTERDLDAQIALCADVIKTFWKNRNGASSTGRAIFKEAIETVFGLAGAKGADQLDYVDAYLTQKPFEVVDQWKNTSGYVSDAFIDLVIANRRLIFFAIVDSILGLKGRLVRSFELSKVYNWDFFAVMQTNPYYLSLLDCRVKVEDLDKLGMLYGVDLTDPCVAQIRNIACVHNYLLNNDNYPDDTAVELTGLLGSVQVGYVLGKRELDLLQASGAVLTAERISNALTFINPVATPESFKLSQVGWKQVASGTHVLPVGIEAETAVVDYLNSGAGIQYTINGVTWVSDFMFAKKEMFVYKRLRELVAQNQCLPLDTVAVDKCIQDFERMKSKELGIADFKLEALQAEAVRLVQNSVVCLTGPAGSGKTTTAEALVYAVETLLGVDPDGIMFCAPTGKAANRLKEIVKRKTRTIHSLFGVGGESFSLHEEDTRFIPKKDDIKVLIVDESSMINIDLMYNMLSKIADGTRIFFIGDKEQLPPIGFGKPFANLLSFLPCVVLTVTKRASDSSGITRNAKEIITNSDDVSRMRNLVDAPDFRIIDCTGDKAARYILDICRYHLGKGPLSGVAPVNLQTLAADDILVVSPVNTPTYSWGTRRLNVELQNIFNPVKEGSRVILVEGYGSLLEFRIGDRVLHTQNNSDRIRLFKAGKNSFGAYKSTGVMNGDVGKIEGLYKASDIDFDGSPDGAKISKRFQGGHQTLFLAVEYRDVDIESGSTFEFIILYQCDMQAATKDNIKVRSSELGVIELAYALTVHKLQGSQAKLIICVIGHTRRVGFISRNMIYTAITRAQKACYLIGSITGTKSAVNEGRLVEQTNIRVTVVDTL